MTAGDAALAIGGPAVHGVVVESGSGTPIAGAQVLVLWSGTRPKAIHGTGAGCYALLNAITDSAGQFAVSGWEKPISGVEVDDYAIHVYARGHSDATGQTAGRLLGGLVGHPGRVASGGNRIEVARFDGSVRERLEQLAFLRSDVRCAEGGASRRNALDFYRSMNEELRELAETPAGRAIAEEEKAEVERRARLGLYRAMPLLVIDLAPTIAALESAHDSELFEPMPKSR